MDDVAVDELWRKRPLAWLGAAHRWVILVGALLSVVVARACWHYVWKSYACQEHFDRFWVRDAIWIGIAVGVVVAFAPRGRVPRCIRLAVVLPVLQLVAAIASTALWWALDAHAEDVHRTDIFVAMPIGGTSILAITAVFGFAAWIVQRRDWPQTLLVSTLSFLLLLGAWLPCCAALWLDETRSVWQTLEAPKPFLLRALVPPFVTAVAYTAYCERARVDKRPSWMFIGVGLLLVAACASQLGPSARLTQLYLESAQSLLAAQGLAIVSLIIACLSIWLRSRRVRAVVRGARREVGVVVDAHEDAVVELRVESWLRAPRLAVSPMEISTADNRVQVSGAPLVWSVPLQTTELDVGERCTLVRRGDPLAIYWRDMPSTGGPYRGAACTEVVAIGSIDRDDAADWMLMQWRPAAAYIFISLAIMIPIALALAK